MVLISSSSRWMLSTPMTDLLQNRRPVSDIFPDGQLRHACGAPEFRMRQTTTPKP
jgi:hypothetical protein